MMPRPSSIDLLPQPVKESLNEWLRDPATTQMEAVDRANLLLEQLGLEDRLTKSSVNRYAVKMASIGEKLRQSREISEMWIGKLGAAPQGAMGHMINELIRSMTFDVGVKLQEGDLKAEDLPGTIAMLKDLALTAARLEQASSANVKREAEIRKQEREKAQAEAVEAAATSMASQGMTRESIDAIKRDILGIA